MAQLTTIALNARNIRSQIGRHFFNIQKAFYTKMELLGTNFPLQKVKLTQFDTNHSLICFTDSGDNLETYSLNLLFDTIKALFFLAYCSK